MKLELLGWRSRSLRCIDLELDLTRDGNPFPVSLLQMPNGTGKTTTLRCLRAALTGEATQWPPHDVRELFPPNCGETGEFEVRLRFNDRPLTLSMKIDRDAGEVHYATTYGRNRNPKYAPPPELHRFLTDHFVRLLVFDGELPGELMDPLEARAQEAIDAFFQLYLLDEIRDAIEGIWRRHANQVQATEATGLTRRRNDVIRAQKKLKELETSLQTAQLKHAETDRAVQDLNRQLNEVLYRTEELQTRRREIEIDLQDANQKVADSLRELMDRIREPHTLVPRYANLLSDLKEHLDRLKLPETTSRQFFEELAEGDECVCGREIGDVQRHHIRAQADSFMGAQTAGVLNALKSDVTRFIESGSEQSNSIRSQAGSLAELVHSRDSLQSSLVALQMKLVEKGGDDAKSLQAKLEQFERQRTEYSDFIEELERDPLPTDDKNSLCIRWWNETLREAEKKLAEITQTVELKDHRDLLVSIVSRGKELAKERLTGSILDEMNLRLESLLKGHDIRVEGISNSLELERQSGASQGQTLAVGYSFLATLFNRGQNAFPFIVDAPVLALDSKVGAEVGQIIPSVCPQFIGFVLDRERLGFVESLHQAANGDVLYLTAFEDSPRNETLSETLPETGVERQGATVIVNGRSYFNSVRFLGNSELDEEANG